MSEEKKIILKKMYCKKCQKEVMALKEPKTTGKQTANFVSIAVLGLPAYVYAEKCPHCGGNTVPIKAKQKIAILCSIIILGSIIMAMIRFR